MKTRQFNDYIALGTIAIVDISTKKHPEAEMKIDLDVWLDLLDQGIGRVCCNGVGYAQGVMNKRVERVHKLITPHFKLNVDHINGDPLDNRMSNLRDVTQGENCRNLSLSKRNKSGCSGVNERKGVKGSTWQVQIKPHGTTLNLGTFKTLAKAIEVRKAAEVRLGFHKNHGKAAK